MKRTFNVDFKHIMEIASLGRGSSPMSNEEIDEIYEIGVYHGLWSGKNYGRSDRDNSVSGLMCTLEEIMKSSSSKEPEPTREELLQTFHVKINNGPERVIKTKTGLYHLAVSASLAMLEYEEASDGKNIVEIWCPTLLPNYGPYFYMVDSMQTYNLHENPFK